MSKLGLSAREIGGRLSSVGHALRKLSGRSHPVVRDRANGALIYRMDRGAAEALRQLASQ